MSALGSSTAHTRSSHSKATTSDGGYNSSALLSGSGSGRDNDETEDLLSEYASGTTFFDDESNEAAKAKDKWSFQCYKCDGKVHIFGEWLARTKSYRYAVIGPDWPCVLATYVMIVVPAVFVYLYLVNSLAEEIVFFIVFGLTVFGLTTVFVADPGLVRNYHHARSRHWTYCDHCESYRPPGTVHCSSCQVCIAGYDHHCPWTGKCIGHGNIFFFKVFVLALAWFVILIIVLGILEGVGVK